MSDQIEHITMRNCREEDMGTDSQAERMLYKLKINVKMVVEIQK